VIHAKGLPVESIYRSQEALAFGSNLSQDLSIVIPAERLQGARAGTQVSMRRG
jgi:hypothetical protein